MTQILVGGPLDGAIREIPDCYNLWFVLISTSEEKSLKMRAFYELQPFQGDYRFVYGGTTPEQ